MTRISGNMVRVSFGTGRVIEKKGLSGSGSNLQTLAYQASPLLTELLRLHDNDVSLIVMKRTVLYYHGTELHQELCHWSFRISISSSRHCICFICFLCIVYEIETMASSSKSEVWKYFVREGTETK